MGTNFEVKAKEQKSLHNNIGYLHVLYTRKERMQQKISGIYLHISGSETRHILLQLLQPWQAHVVI